ncbi:hypothetical protein HAHE_08730 [Haloferula helveola]|uniref:Uncharacterized protein n=1 Tax=Haloferula helveola TaxID=490095 RepID=A0ABM7R7W5_9BACT|nr:hypothetical protein HAHE_08730 [Haloferula helveola]
MKRIALLPILLASVAFASESLPLASTEYTLILTHEAKRPEVRLPGDAIPEKEYRAVKERSILHVRFTEDRKAVEIMPAGIVGKVANADAKKRVYRLTKGLFAGGQLIIESTANGLTATLTEYGSGVPVISSVRGEFKPKAPEAEPGGAGRPATSPQSDLEGGEKPQPKAETSSR